MATRLSKEERTAMLRRLRGELVGLEVEVPLLDGSQRRYVNLDNAASTPTFRSIQKKVDEFLALYSNVHRGTGFKSQIASWAYEEARRVVADFVKADLSYETVIFTKNTTESINKLARLYPFRSDSIVITSVMEHHSNELPWRRRTGVVHTELRPDGSLDVEDYARKLDQYRGHVDLVALTGASNVSGLVNPVHKLARMAHDAGARILIDAAQLAPHRPIDMRPHSDPEHLDFVAFSAHKMYAPYGVGALVGDRESLYASEPESVGGGVVDLVTIENAYWRDLPEREEAGTPDIVGVVALAVAARLLESIGWDVIIEHETRLTRYAFEKLGAVPGITIYGAARNSGPKDRLGVIAFNLKDVPHAQVAGILSYEGAIGVRNGCFCAHSYVQRLLGVTEEEAQQVQKEILERDRSRIPGAVRASVGIYNDESDIDALCGWLQKIADGRYTGKYEVRKESGWYVPEGESCFVFEREFTMDPELP
ncbi:MAG: aminotransferase class V-fold PLP-dependent enzyme [candidate division WOR-3 bacterium]|nr:MAG: aminotransferase class V-fold PLP-dependent enzyme [candidate division WOR-3 bacterium]